MKQTSSVTVKKKLAVEKVVEKMEVGGAEDKAVKVVAEVLPTILHQV